MNTNSSVVLVANSRAKITINGEDVSPWDEVFRDALGWEMSMLCGTIRDAILDTPMERDVREVLISSRRVVMQLLELIDGVSLQSSSTAIPGMVVEINGYMLDHDELSGLRKALTHYKIHKLRLPHQIKAMDEFMVLLSKQIVAAT